MTTHGISRRNLLRAGVGAAAGAALVKPSRAFAAPAVIQGGPVTIRFMTHNTLEKPAGDVLKQMITEFEEQNPDIKIQIEEVPNADILTKLTAYAEGNDLPDVIDGQFGLASFINLDAALDITDRVTPKGCVNHSSRSRCKPASMAKGVSWASPSTPVLMRSITASTTSRRPGLIQLSLPPPGMSWPKRRRR